jgi:hypothetical protein
VRRGCKRHEGAAPHLHCGHQRHAPGVVAAERARVGSKVEYIFVVEVVQGDKDGRHGARGPCRNPWAWS